jgi:hypothetical protein
LGLDATSEHAGHAGELIPNSATIIDDGTNKSVTVPATNSAQFFRLRRP